jgi:pyruvate dehydrogenase E2 component (dihydrolipoamide acetyltransferase)
MATELKVPKLGMDMEEANILRWLVEEGAKVEKGDPVIEIDTDKVSYEVEANAGGIIRGLRGTEGETVLVGFTLAYIVAPGEEFAEPEAASVGNGAAPTAEESPLQGGGTASPVADSEPEALDLCNGRSVRASPAARRAAVERGLAIADIAGSGPGGRVYLSDVPKADVRQRPSGKAPVTGPPVGIRESALTGGATAPESSTTPPESASDGATRREPLSRVRRVGAERTSRSFAEVPHYYLTRNLEVDRLLELRERLKAKMDPAPSVTELFALAISRILKYHPRLNARYVQDNQMEVNVRVNLGIAVATDEGLMVPVLKDAGTLPLRELVPTTRDLVRRTREGNLGADDLLGGTFTISNLGMMRVDAFDAIINTPQAGILALGRVRTVPVWQDGTWLPQRVISATLSVDHRVADGADGTRFLQSLQEALLDWELLL